ncbi:MAG: DUF3373 domain-containing protein [Desulfobacteria bacterium]
MNRKRAVLSAAILVAVLALPQGILAADEEIQKKVDSLSKEVQALQRQVAQSKEGKKSISDWLTIGGDYRFRVDSLSGKVPDYYGFANIVGWQMGGMVGAPPLTRGETVKNDTLYTNRFGLNLKAKATRNVTFTTRLLMYKAFGNGDTAATSGTFFADRIGVFDGTEGHVPGDGKPVVDEAYATWSNILDQPIWFSVGRRPSTGGIPSHLRQNNEKPGNGGIPALLVDYAFDGMVLGVAPDIDALPGAFAKLCYGRGFENGFTSPSSSNNNIKDTDMLGVSVVPYDTDRLYLNFQYNRGMNIFDFPVFASSTLGPLSPHTDLGDIDWFGATALSTLKHVGPGILNVFGSAALSKTHPNGKTVVFGGIDTGAGLMYTGHPESKTGEAIYVGGRYDFPSTRTKIGAEYNYGSKDWITFVPAGDDIWTSKLGTRGSVYEVYLIQEINAAPVSSYIAKTFFRFGYQYYDFQYTGSNSWVGAPVKIADLAASPMNAQLLTPMKSAQDIYATMEVKF